MNYKKEIETKGYFILENVFTPKEMQTFNTDLKNFIANNRTIKNAGGITIPDFIRNPELTSLAEMRNHPKIQGALKQIFGGEDYRFTQHNDIGVNRVVHWHKDKLNGPYTRFETIDVWADHQGQKHEIVKVLIYLQDHANNNDALKIVPGSHKIRNVNQRDNIVQLKPKLGDVLIFDQRITHRGMARQVKKTRVLVAFGYGKNNIFTDNFEKGTVQRQNDQNKTLTKK